MNVHIGGRMMTRKSIRRYVGIGLLLVACAVALATPVAFAHRSATRAPIPSGNIANGFRVFNDYFCAHCHVMKAAGPASYRGYNVCDGDTACNVGVNFNKSHVSYQAVIAVVTAGLPAALPLYPTQMPPYRKVLTNSQIRDVAAFLAKYSGGYNTCTECKGVVPTGFPTG
jgi:Cytochrome C oxidase, cbb3-type, subunit III